MNPARAGLDAIAIFTILFLLGIGIVVYAVPGAGAGSKAPAGSSSTTSSSEGNEVTYRLVQVAPPTPRANASGYAGISISDQSLAVEWSVSGAPPGENLQMVMETASSAGVTKSFTFATVQVTSQATAGSAATATLDPGYYYVGLTVVDPATSSRTTIFVSDPASIQVAIVSSQATQPTAAVGDGLSYNLIPLPAYLHQAVQANYSFKEGGALIVASGDRLQVTTSFVGSADTVFTNVLQTAGRNITAGRVTTSSTGGGVFKGNVTLDPGTYQVGLLLFVSGSTASPVAVSSPRAIQVTLPAVSTASGSSTTSRTSSSGASTSSSSKGSTSSRITTSSPTTTRSNGTSTTTSKGTAGPESSQAANQLVFAPVRSPNAPEGYLYGEGSGGYSVTGGNIYFSLVFTGQSPSTQYSLVLSVNGTARTIGDYTTSPDGGGTDTASTTLGNGRFALSLTVFDLSSFSSPTEVLAGVPSSFTVNAYGATTSTTTAQSTTSSFLATTAAKGPDWTFKLVPAVVENVPKGYRFATSGTATVSLDNGNSLLDVELGFQDANPSTTYDAALVLNGTTVNLGTMTTNRAGGTVLHSSIQVGAGTYLLGLMVYDASDITAFKADAPVLVMVSDPNTQLAVIVPQTGAASSTLARTSSASQSSNSSQSVVTSTVTKTVTTIDAGTKLQAQIQSEVDNLTIPATVEVTPLSSSTTVLDSRFSLSVGQQIGNGLAIAISGENVTGSRVLLINMSRTDPLALYPALNVTLDGVQVMEASSTLQVLNPSPSNPPLYVLVATSNSIQLLVSIPHFSLHLIQVAGVIVQNVQAALELDAPLLAGSILVITIAFAGAYAARKRYFPVPA